MDAKAQQPKLLRKDTPPATPGTLRIKINNCFLNDPVKRPYITITLGGQYYKTSVSEYPQGSWNEWFELKLTYHNQLFDTIQLDLYESNTFFLDKHVGRAEIRLRNLEGMPETFTSYYEVLEKRLSLGAISQVSRKTTMTSGVGAIQAQISYQYIKATTSSDDRLMFKRSATLDSIETTASAQEQEQQETDVNNNTTKRKLSDNELIEEFNKHLKSQRKNQHIQFNKFEENQPKEEEEEGDYPLDDDHNDSNVINNIDQSSERRPSLINGPTTALSLSVSRASTIISSGNVGGQTSTENTTTNNEKGYVSAISDSISSFFGYSTSAPTTSTLEENKRKEMLKRQKSLEDKNRQKHIVEDDEDIKGPFPLLDTIGSWTMAKETNQVLRTIAKLLVSFNQGFELSNLQILSGFSVIEKYYSDLPRDRTWDIVEDLSEIEMASHMWRHAIASYGWKGLNFIGKGNGIFSDAVRAQSDALSICEHLNIPKEDLLAYELRTSAAFRPSYYIARDRKLNAIVLSIRGTMSTFDTMTDLVCEYEPWKGGIVHKGMKSSANWFFKNIAPKLIAYVNKHSTASLYIVGHSLGASTAAILTIMLQDHITEFRKGKDDDFTIHSIGYAPACGLSLDLANKYKDQIQSFVFADDCVSKLSYGSMMDVKELIIAGAEAAKNLGIGELLWSGESDNKKWKAAFERIAECRKRCLESMSNPRLYVAGTVYQFWLDPIPNNESRIVIERTTPERVSTELILRMSIFLDHLPSNFDVAFKRAIETLDMRKGGSVVSDEDVDGYLDENPTHRRKSLEEGIFDSIAEAGLKNTTERSGGEGNVTGQREAR